MPTDTFKLRHQMFLDIAIPMMEAWDKALMAEEGIDFEDMLNLAAGHLESGRVESPYDLVMADEFQDASRARARLCRALVQGKGRFFFAVGDDWQSINRFAGADVSVMTSFRQWFGHGQVLKLEQTFRCPQALCDVSSAFVSKNPVQIAKRVHSTTTAQGPVLQAFQVDSKEQLADAINRFVMNLAEGVRDGTIPPGRNGKVSVYVLGRYNGDRQYVPMRPIRFNRWVDVSFLTIHRSKGSEADYVILPEMISAPQRRSFPNTRTDDPVLALAMPEGDTFPLGEERRLFYVALTRARRNVAMFTARGQCSTFLRELQEDGVLEITNTEGKAVKEAHCPACKQGVLVLRTGPYGEFHACSNFPVCSYKPRRRGVDPSPLAAQTPLPESNLAVSSRPQVHPAPTSQPAPSKRTLFSILESFNNGLAEISRSVDRANALQNATSDLKHQISAEKSTIESALKLARSQISLDEKLKDPRFKEAYESLSGALTAHRDKASDPQRPAGTPLPAFTRPQRHPVEEFEVAIQRSFDGLREDREAFLSVAYGQLAGDPLLRRHFFASLEKINGNRYRASVDPYGTLEQRG